MTILLVLLLLVIGCSAPTSSPGQQEGVRSVLAEVRGITWPTCAATMEVALRRRLEGVAVVSISQSRQTAEVEFAPGDHVFSPAAFRAATAEAGVEVLTFQIDACGVIEQTGDSNWLIAGKNRFLLVERGTAPVGSAVCVSGRLHDRPSRPHRLRIVHVELVAGDARRAPE